MSFLAESYLHRLDPFAIQLTETFGLRWYGLSYAVGFLVAWMILRWMARTGRTPLTRTDVGDLIFAIVIGVIIGGRVGYALLYQPGLFVGFTSEIPFWDLLAINKGGMASHGGMLGVIIAMIVFARRRGQSSLHLIDLTAFIAPPGLFFGRLANFVNGELPGKKLPTSMYDDPPWWSVKYADYEHVAELSPDVLEPLRGHVGGDETFATGVVDALRQGDAVVTEKIVPLLDPHYPSQLLQAITDGPILLAALVLIWWRPRKPGVVGACFLIVYGLLRIATEVVREPDEGVALFLGLSRGQTISVVMTIVGAVSLIIVSRRDVARLGGFGPKSA